MKRMSILLKWDFGVNVVLPQEYDRLVDGATLAAELEIRNY